MDFDNMKGLVRCDRCFCLVHLNSPQYAMHGASLQQIEPQSHQHAVRELKALYNNPRRFMHVVCYNLLSVDISWF